MAGPRSSTRCSACWGNSAGVLLLADVEEVKPGSRVWCFNHASKAIASCCCSTLLGTYLACRSHDEQPLGVDTSYGHDSGLAISARAHGAAL